MLRCTPRLVCTLYVMCRKISFDPNEAAYFTLVMCGDDYQDAAVALANSIECSGTRVRRRYCLVTHDVSPDAVERLARSWTVVRVDYLSRSNLPPLLTRRMNEVYGSWISKSFTKWEFIRRMETYGVRYALYLDADTVVLKNFDPVFERIASSDVSRLTVYVNMFPFFDTKPKTTKSEAWSSYAGFGSFVRGREETSSPDEWRVPVDALAFSTFFDQTTQIGSSSYARAPVVRRSVSNLEATATITRGRGRNASFLFHSSIVMVAEPTSDFTASVSFYETLTELLRKSDNPLFARCRFANGWDEQLLAQTIATMRPSVRLFHLRSLHNVVVGQWDTRRKAEQPYSITWYGTCKPWRNLSSCPEYADEYLFRYFYYHGPKHVSSESVKSSEPVKSSESVKSSKSVKSSESVKSSDSLKCWTS